MNFHRISIFLEKFIFYGLASILVLPLFPFSRPIFGFLFRTEFVFQIIVETIFLFWLLWLFFKVRINADKNQHESARIRIDQHSIIFWGALLFVLALGLATLFAYNPTRSLFSSLERLSGYFLLIHLFLFFLVAVSILRDKQSWLKLISISVATSGLASFYAIGQKIGLLELSSDGRASAAFGNPAFFAAYLLFHVFLSLYLSFRREQPFANRSLFLGIAALDVIGIFLSATRATMLGLVAGLFLSAVFFLFQRSREYLRFRKLAKGTLGVLVAFLLLIFLLGQALPENTYLSRLSQPRLIFEVGLQNRLLVWQIAWKVFQEKPVLGWGMDNFSYGFDRNFDPKILENVRTQEAWFDRPHNVFLDYLTSAGIIGFLGYLAFLVSLFWGSFSLAKKEPAGGILFGIVPAYLLQALFLFDVFPVYLMLFLLAGFLFQMRIDADDEPLINADANRYKSASIGKNQHESAVWSRLVLVPLLLFSFPALSYIAWSYNLKPARALGFAFFAGENFSQNQADFKTNWQKSFSFENPYTEDTWLELSNFVLNDDPAKRKVQIKFADLRQALETSLATFEELEKDSRLGARYYYQAGRVGNLARSFGSSFSDTKVEAWLQQALEISPKRVDVYYELADLERSRKNTPAMFRYLEQAIAIDPDIPQSYFNLGISYAETGKLEEAIALLEKSEKLGYSTWRQDYPRVVFWIDVYLKAKRHDENLVSLYKSAIQLQPQDPQLYGSLAFLLKGLGRFDEAAFYAKKVAELDPSRRGEVEEFLSTLPRPN